MFELGTEDHAGIQRLFAEYSEAWARRDAAGCAALFAPDGDGFALDGEVLSGPAEIEAYYERQLSGKHGKLAMTDFELSPARGLGPGVALMNGTWQVHGFRSPSGGSAPVRVRGTFVLRKDDGRWRYVAVRFMVPFVGEVEDAS